MKSLLPQMDDYTKEARRVDDRAKLRDAVRQPRQLARISGPLFAGVQRTLTFEAPDDERNTGLESV